MDRYFAAGGPKDVDVITFHSYRSRAEDVASDAAAMQTVAAKYGLSSKPLWDTEGSWGSARLTASQQAGFIASTYLLLWSKGVSRFYWYAWDSPTFGTLSGASKDRPAPALAYEQVARWMIGGAMESPCSMEPDSTWICVLKRPDGHPALAIWNASSERRFAGPSGYDAYLDLAGDRHSVVGAVAIGEQPMLFVRER